jgi:uracil-DNA glycosylase
MRDSNVRQQRKAMLDLPHIAQLTAYAAGLRRGTLEVPDFDPLDGGADARVLFLLEKPGPMTAESGKRTGSGFISRDNDDATAEATFNFMERAGIPRKLTVIWNVVPWWNGTRKVTAREISQGAACVTELVTLLPSLAAVVLVGARAARAKPYLEATNLALITSCHPSPLVRARYRAMWETIPLQWAKAMVVVEESRGSLPSRR